MKRVLSFVAVVMLLGSAALSQSLGEVARQNRQAKQTPAKRAARVYTNDDIPEAKVAPAAKAAESTPQSPSASAENAPERKADSAEPKPGEKAQDKATADVDAERKKEAETYRARIEEQTKSIALLEREVSVLQRENQIQQAVYYADAGSRLRAPKDWTERQKKYEGDFAEKNKALQEAKDKLDLLEEEARRAGEGASK
jgi:hypothetical protein